MGPGTHIMERVQQSVLPTSFVDTLALMHDIEYLASHSYDEELTADYFAVNKAPWVGVQSAVFRVGLCLKQLVGMSFADSKSVNCQKALILANKLSEEKYMDVLRKYDLVGYYDKFLNRLYAHHRKVIP
jgi:hypothetical protein